MGKFMIVLRGEPSEWKKIPEHEQNKIIEKYMAWVERLKAENIFKSGSECQFKSEGPHRGHGGFLEGSGKDYCR